MERDGDTTIFSNNKPSLFLLGEDQKLHHIKNCSERDGYECNEIYDFTKHKMDAIIVNDWDTCHMSSQAITYDEVVFQVNYDHPKARKASKAYFWFDHTHIEEDPSKVKKKDDKNVE